MPFTTEPRPPRPAQFWAKIIEPEDEGGVLSVALTNASSGPEAFFIQGTTLGNTKVELDGNTDWSTPVVPQPRATAITVRHDDVDGDVLAEKMLTNLG